MKEKKLKDASYEASAWPPGFAETILGHGICTPSFSSRRTFSALRNSTSNAVVQPRVSKFAARPLGWVYVTFGKRRGKERWKSVVILLGWVGLTSVQKDLS